MSGAASLTPGVAGLTERLAVTMLVGNPCVNDTRVLKEASSLARAGYRTTVICDNDHGALQDDLVDGVHLRRVDMSIRGSLGRGPRRLLDAWRPPRGQVGAPVQSRPLAAGLTRKLVWGADKIGITLLRYRAILAAARTAVGESAPGIVHAHDLETLPAAALLARRAGASLIYDAHELEQFRLDVTLPERRIIAGVEAHFIRQAAAVITVCDSIAERLRDDYGIRLPSVVMNAPSLEMRQAIEPRLRARLGLAESIPLAVYVGRIARGRGLEQVLQALPLWPLLHLACVGGADAQTAGALQAQARALGVQQRVHFVAPVAPFAVLDFIRTADFSVVPTQDACLNYRYSLPNKLFESTFAGLPLCASDLPEQRRFVETAGNGLLMEAHSPGDIARVMQEVYARRSELRPSAARLRELALTYAWQAQSTTLLALYAALAAGRSRVQR